MRHIRLHHLDPPRTDPLRQLRPGRRRRTKIERAPRRAPKHARIDALRRAFTVCVTSPPSRTRRHSPVNGLATHTAFSASRQMPSGNTGSPAHSRRFESVPSAPMSKAVRHRPTVSAAISVSPSGVITMPFGNRMPSAATVAVPSACTSMIVDATNGSPLLMSKPDPPTYARPSSETVMSLICTPSSDDRSATTSPAAAVIRTSVRSTIRVKQVAVRQPAPPRRLMRVLDDACRLPVRRHPHDLVRMHVREPKCAGMPPRALRKGQIVEQDVGRGIHAA